MKSRNLESAAKKEGWDGVSPWSFGDTFSSSGRACDSDRQIQGEKLMKQAAKEGKAKNGNNILDG